MKDFIKQEVTLKVSEKKLSSSQLREMKKFGSRIKNLGANFAIYSITGEIALLCEGGNFKSCEQQLADVGKQILEKNNYQGDVKTKVGFFQPSQEKQILGVGIQTGTSSPEFALLIDTGGIGQIKYLSELLSLFSENYLVTSKIRSQTEKVSIELTQVYEELVLLHKLSLNMRISESYSNYLQMSCDSLTEIVLVEGIAILLEKPMENEKSLVLAAGSGIIDIDEHMAGVLRGRLTGEINKGKEALLDSEVDSPFKFNWPANIQNIIAVPLCCKTQSHIAEKPLDGDGIIGMMVAVNRIDKPDFDSIDVKLFNSVANSCAVFIENGNLFRDLKELFIGSLRALTSSIDAKDQYTRGHSERVAFISRWIAERPGLVEDLEQEQIHRIYLSGLLHDIGKVGVDEALLRKKDKLTERELGCIKSHPSIGASILSEIKQMHDIVPGVLFHHERVDGKGYPNGLVGEQIPFIARIVQLADCFDAMTSKRTYRDALSLEQAIGEIEKNSGTQFDEKIARIFLNSDIYQLWRIIENGFSETYLDNDFSEYGTIAVGTLIR